MRRPHYCGRRRGIDAIAVRQPAHLNACFAVRRGLGAQLGFQGFAGHFPTSLGEPLTLVAIDTACCWIRRRRRPAQCLRKPGKQPQIPQFQTTNNNEM